MLTLFDPGRLEASAAEALSVVNAEPRIVCVQGPLGAGRSLVEKYIRAQHPDAVFLQAPSLSDPDAVAHTLLQLAATAELMPEALKDSVPLRERSFRLGKALKDRVVVLRIPESWEELGDHHEPDHELFQTRARDLLLGLRDVSTLRVVLFASLAKRTPWQRFGLSMPVVNLPQPRLLQEALLRSSEWGTYAHAAAAVAGALNGREKHASPIHIRLLVGLVGLGMDPRDMLALLPWKVMGPATLDRLLEQLKSLLTRDRLVSLRDGLIRCARARFALPVDAARGLASLSQDDEPLLTACVGYETGDACLRIPQPVRRALLDMAADPDEETQFWLAGHYAKMDGVVDPNETSSKTIFPWLEKVHHLARSGSLGEEQWSQQKFGNREFYWDRARALSILWKKHLAAAEVYKQCTDRFPEDDYAWHYYAWNLDRAGVQPDRADFGFERAVDLAKTNLWWNSRRITFLISRGRFLDADAKWEEALERFEEAHLLDGEDEQVACDFHAWVVRAWLDHGEVDRARQAFAQIPVGAIARIPQLRDLEWRLLDAEETENLGTSVYPPGMPIEHRWRQPKVVSEVGPDDSKLVAWYPGRVVAASATGVELVVATPIDPVRVLRTTISAAEWRAFQAPSRPQDASGYIFLARYEKGAGCIVPMASSPVPWERERPAADPLRYLRPWSDG